MGWLIAAAVIVLLLFLKISVRVRYTDDTKLTLGIGIFRIRLMPRKEKTARLSDYKIKKFRRNQEKAAKKEASQIEKKEIREKRKQDADQTKKAKKSEGEEASEKRDIMGLVGTLTHVTKIFLSRFGHHLRIDMRRLVIIMATGDAAKTAVLYGAVCGAVQCLLELIYNCMHLTLPKNEAFYENIVVSYDFLAEKTKAEVDLTFSFRTWQLFDILLRAGFQFIKNSLNHS